MSFPRRDRCAITVANRGTSVVITSLVSSLAVATLGGCAGSPFDPQTHTRENQADLASVHIDQRETVGEYSKFDYNRTANSVNLPERWRSEAQTARSFEEARRAAAQTQYATADANEKQALAHTDAEFRRAVSDLEIGQAEAQQLEQVYQARLAELEMQARAQDRANRANATRNDAVLGAQEKTWETEFERMRAEADAEWRRAQAEFARMQAEREAVANRGNANITQMRRVADLTDERAVSKVAALRTEARSVSQQTTAEVESLNALIGNTQEQFTARVSELRRRANTTRDDAAGRVADLRARAAAHESQGVTQTFNLDIKSARTALEQAAADSDQLRQDADALIQRVNAEAKRLRGEAAKFRANIDTERGQLVGELDRWHAHEQAGIDFRNAEAERIEAQARAAFVAAEADARARAIREQAQHQRVLSKAELRRIEADAQAEAARISGEVSEQIAEQLRRGQVYIPGKEESEQPGAESGQPLPVLITAGPVGERLEPERVFRFKAALAEAEQIRVNERAVQAELDAETDRRGTNITAWWDEQVAAHQSQLAAADTFEARGFADYEQLNLTAEGILAQAKAQHDRALVEADADRDDTLATITSLRAEADAIAAKSQAAVTQLTAAGDAAEHNGRAEVAKLTVQRDSVSKRGQARSERLLAEADALEKSQRAVVAQMREEIQTADRVLVAELERLDKVGESFHDVARATYDESITIADTFAEIAEVNAQEIAVANASKAEMGAADVEYLQRVAKATELAAQAAVERLAADAERNFGRAEADDMVARARISAEANIARAAAAAQEVIADANDEATQSLFQARIVQTGSERNRAYADEYLETVRRSKQVEQSVAASRAYREISAMAVERFNQASREFQTAARENWDARLAFPTPQPMTAGPTFFYDYTNPTFTGQFDQSTPEPGDTIQFVDVPVTD
ncbi:MAG: hypothetical protein AAGI30_07270 [Planctomycetota bacterium]